MPRNADFVMHGGRCETDVSYVAVLEDAGDDAQLQTPRLRALDMHVVLQGGAYLDISHLDAMGLVLSVDSVYDIPAFRYGFPLPYMD